MKGWYEYACCVYVFRDILDSLFLITSTGKGWRDVCEGGRTREGYMKPSQPFLLTSYVLKQVSPVAVCGISVYLNSVHVE